MPSPAGQGAAAVAPPRGSRLGGFAAVSPRGTAAAAFTFLSASGGSRLGFLPGGKHRPPGSRAGALQDYWATQHPDRLGAGWGRNGSSSVSSLLLFLAVIITIIIVIINTYFFKKE